MTTTTHPAELHDGVWTSWLPVTTAWPSNPACNSAAWARYGIDENAPYWPYIYDPAYGVSVANSPTCLPPEATSWWDLGITVNDLVTSYSIGPIVCPDAYTTISTSVVSGSSTSVICCPREFGFARSLAENGGLDGICTSVIPSGQSLSYASPTSNSFAPATTTFTNSALLLAIPVEGYNFAISSTTSISSSTSSSSSSGSSSTTQSSSSTGISSSTGASDSGTATRVAQKSGGLSQGAKIGIGIAVPVIVLIVAAIAVRALLFRRRPKQAELDGSGAIEARGEEAKGGYYRPVEMDAVRQPSEVNGVSKPVELYG